MKHLSKHTLNLKVTKKPSDFIKYDFITNFCPVKDLHRFKNINVNGKSYQYPQCIKNFYKVLISH